MPTNISFDPIRPHNLDFLPPNFNYKDGKFTNLLIKARVELAELKGFGSGLPNQLLLLSPTILKEAIASSGIENINTTMVNVLENQLFPEQEQRPADKEVLRYQTAIAEGLTNLEKYSLSTRTILQIHKTLLTNSSGQYRKKGVKIENSTTKETIYTPPEAGKINDLINNLENFINQKDDIDPLIKAAIIHYQFEAIHPFDDCNGRVGRILMVLHLVQNNLLHYPILFISGYLLKNRPEYYNLLKEVTVYKKWAEYIEFMLKGFYHQATETKDLLFRIKIEYFEFKEILRKNHKRIYSADLTDGLFAFPVITPARLAQFLGCDWETARNYLKTLTEAGLLKDRKIKKYHFYMNTRLLEILHA